MIDHDIQKLAAKAARMTNIQRVGNRFEEIRSCFCMSRGFDHVTHCPQHRIRIDKAKGRNGWGLA